MGFSSLTLLAFFSSFVFFLVCTEARWHHHHHYHHHHHTKHKHNHYNSRKESTISAPPDNSDPPDAPPELVDPPYLSPDEPADPPYLAPDDPVKPPYFAPDKPALPPYFSSPEPVKPPFHAPDKPSVPPYFSPPEPVKPPFHAPDKPSTPPSPHEPANPPLSPPESSKLPPSPSPAASSPPPDDERYHNPEALDVRKFGAVGDGITDDTDAFKTAWDTACSQNDTAVILVPYGFKFMIQSTIFTGPCQGGILFQVDGTIMPPDGPDSWPRKNSKRQWLVFYRINEMSLVGGGTIDGRGEKWWDLPCKPHKGINGTTMPGPCDSPIAIRFFMSSNLTVQGIRVKNSPQFNFRFDNCKNVHIDSVHIIAPALSPNTDGIHIENTNNVEIYDTVISNGDDCVSIGSGCFDVDIRNVTCGPSHGISIGSLGNHNSRACVSNITVRDSVIKASDNGVRIKTWQGGSGAVTGITFSNIHMDNVRNPIIIDQFYCLTKDCSNKTSAVYVSDILYENIKGTYNIRSPPMHFACSDSVPCTNLTLSEVELLPAQGDLVLDPFCWNAYGELETLTIPPVSCLMEGTPSSLINNDIDYC